MLTTRFVIRHTSALILSVALSIVGMPLSVSAAGEEDSAVTRHRGLTLNGRPLSQLLRTTVATEGMVGLPGLVEQGTGQISGVALDAEGHPLADHAVELLGVSEQGAATSVVARTTTSATGGFSFPGLSQGRYMVDVRADGRLVATSGATALAEGGMTFTQVGGVADRQSATDNRKGKGGIFWMGVGAGVGGVVGLAMCLSDPTASDPENLCWLAAGGITGMGALIGLLVGQGR